MPDLDRIHIVIENLPDARAQVSVNIHTPHPGMHLATPAHVLAIDALGWMGKHPAVAGFVYSPSSPSTTYLAGVQQHKSTCTDISCTGCIPVQAAHIVLDLETLSTQPSAAIASIGAVALTAHGGFVSEFHVAVDTGAPQHLRHACPNTIAWWDKQSDAAKAASIQAADTLLPSQALHAFTAWVEGLADPKKVKVWGNGSSFDNVILSSLYADYPEKVRPWAYWNDRDMRTVLDLYPQAKDVGEFEGIKHNALHDARHEAKQLAAALRLAAGAATPPAHAQSDELEALRDMLDTARIDLDMLREALCVPVEPHQSLSERMLEAAQARDVQRDAAFEAVRKKFCKLQRYSFLLDDKGNVRRVPDYSGNWVEFEAAHTLFDPASVDAAFAAQATQGAAA